MSVPVSQMWSVVSYLLKQKIRKNKRYPLVLMLEPLFRCNLACAGCGKVQFPAHILKKELSVEDCLSAVDQCGAPIVSIPGGEPLLYPNIGLLVSELVKRRKYIYLCTNGLLLKEKLEAGLFKPSKYLNLSVHLDGLEKAHDLAVCRDGVYRIAEDAIRLAVDMGFRVTTNTTIYYGAEAEDVRKFFDRMMVLGVEGMTISPGYAYSKAPDQEKFIDQRAQTIELFKQILGNRNKKWRFNQSPLFLEFLMGMRDFKCTPWGNPTYNIFGWQRPCYLVDDGYAESFDQLINQTDWSKYGTDSGNPACSQCMVHCGHEPSAVDYTFGSVGGFVATIKAMTPAPAPGR